MFTVAKLPFDPKNRAGSEEVRLGTTVCFMSALLRNPNEHERRRREGSAMWISWRQQRSDFQVQLTYDEKVDIFCEQTLGWQLQIADLIANGGTTFPQINTSEPGYEVPSIRHSGFAVLHICFSYFELVGSVVSSEASSTGRFNAGVKEVLPEIFQGNPNDDTLLRLLYKGARCALYHSARPGAPVGLGQPDDEKPIAFDQGSGKVAISPECLPRSLKAHLTKFKSKLMDAGNVDLRQRFEARFDKGFP